MSIINYSGLITQKCAVDNTDATGAMGVHYSSNFGTVLQKVAVYDTDVTIGYKNRPSNSSRYIGLNIHIKVDYAGTNSIGNERAVYNCEISVSNIKCNSTVIMAMKNRIFYCEISY
jgi:hypothetical protein